MYSLSEERQVVGTTELQFHCAVCNETNEVDAFRFKTIDRLLGLIPIWVTHETAVKCPDCNATFRSNCDLDELRLLSPKELTTQFKLRIGFVEKFLVVVGWLLVFTGPVSLGMFVFAWFMVPKATQGWRKAINIGLVVSALFTAFFVFSAIVAP